jgi:hypothetical protein
VFYNFERPHQALDQEVPASRYRPSARAMPEQLPLPQYDERETVRTISFKGRLWKVPQAFCGERLAVRPSSTNGKYALCFGAHHIATIDLTNQQPVGHVSEHMSVISPG